MPRHIKTPTTRYAHHLIGVLLALLYWTAYGSDSPPTITPPITLVTSDLLPYSIQEGREQGSMVELIREIERRLGTNRPVHFLPWPRAIRDTRLSPNHILFPLARTPEREADFDWAIKVAPIDFVFVTLNGRKLDLSQARRLKAIAVQQNTPFEQYLRQQGFTNLVVTTTAAPIPIRMLRAGRVDAWFTARAMAVFSMREQFVTKPITYSDPISSGNIYIAFSKRFPLSIKLAYQAAYREILADGTLQRIMQRYQQQ